MEQTETQKKRVLRRRTFEPDVLKVRILNDDVTTFQFVVAMLEQIFFKSEEEAWALANETDRNGSAVVGTYPADIAQSKVKAAQEMARAANFPLKIVTENA